MLWRRHSDYWGNQIFVEETERRFQDWVLIPSQSRFVEDVGFSSVFDFVFDGQYIGLVRVSSQWKTVFVVFF